MPSICVIVPGMPESENAWFLPYLTDYLIRLHREADVRVYALQYPGKDSIYTLHGIPVTAFRPGWLRVQSHLLSAVTQDHRNKPFTHIHAVWANTAGFFGAMVARSLGLPLTVTMGGEELISMPDIQYGAMRKWRTRPILRYVFSTASAIVAPSDMTATLLRDAWNIPQEKIHRIWFGVDTERFAPAHTPPPEPLHILATGGLIPVKRHSLLLKAFAKVRHDIPEARLTIAGEGPLREQLHSLAKSLDIHENTAFPGWIHHRDMPNLYRSAHIAAIASYREEIPVALLEALASGLGVVSLNTGIAYDLAETNLFPIRISSPHPEMFATQLLELWNTRKDTVPEPLSPEAQYMLSVSSTVDQMVRLFNHQKPAPR